MNHLAIDIGNTRTKFGLFEKKELVHAFTWNNSDLKNNNQLIENYKISHIIISSVNSKAENSLLLDQLKDKIKIFRLKSDTKLPIQLEYQSSETLGKDRLAGVIGASIQIPWRKHSHH